VGRPRAEVQGALSADYGPDCGLRSRGLKVSESISERMLMRTRAGKWSIAIALQCFPRGCWSC